MHTKPRRAVAAALVVMAATWGLANAPAGALAAPSEPSPSDVSSYAPEGTTNLAPDATVTTSSSYEMPSETWAMSYLNNEVAGSADGWSTNPYEKVQDPATPAWVQYDLGASHHLGRVVVFPRQKSFPADYRIEVSSDGDDYRSVYTSTGNADDRAEPEVIDLTDVEGRYLRLYVTLRNGAPSGDGYLVQLSELAVFGTLAEVILSIDKPALLLETGAVEPLSYDARAPGGLPEVVWSSSDPGVAQVDGDGTVTAAAPGEAVITLAAPDLGESTSIPVEVRDHVERMGDKFEISAFWPPTPDHINDIQYSYLGDAGIDSVMANDLHPTKEINLEMARLAHKYGLNVTINDSRFGSNLLNLTDEEIRDLVSEYTNVPGVGGFYILDEPFDPDPYARVFNAIKDAAPEYDAHLNFLPSSVYASEAEYAQVMQGWLDLTGARGYLMYDRYPFGTADNSLDYTGFLTNMNTVRKVGLANGVKTAQYLQAVGIPGGFRRPNETEIRYEANMALAYGYKGLSYFTWFTPTNRSQTFTDAIITADGQKTDLFEPVKQLNSEIHALGPTLMRLDAKEVYLNGQTFGQQPVPEDFFVHSLSDEDLTFSYLRDRENGRNYLMVVNNSFTQERDVSLRFDEAIGSLEEIDRQSGRTVGVALDDGVLDRHLDKGEGVLYALPDGYDYENAPVWNASNEYQAGDRVSHLGKVYLAAWYSKNKTPGDPYGPWQELGITEDGVPAWTASRIFTAGDRVSYQGELYDAKRRTRNQKPGDPDGPWQVVLPHYTFDGDVQGWQAGQNVVGIEQVTSIANGPGHCFSGGCLQADTAAVPATTVRSVYLEPDEPLDMSEASAFSLAFNSWGSVPGATGYQVIVTLTGADGTTLTKTLPTSADSWTTLSLDLTGWAGASEVSRIEVGTSAVGTEYSPWDSMFQIDSVTWR
ncbi:discoidin domain-containing protein [Actinopolymorpha sp. B17G11]|uniref:discoidin domain-containing protein n=1 Tax=Actinopolymorpha sp. B17G11 TaxID=3160861 RepID=UPI0032E42AAE